MANNPLLTNVGIAPESTTASSSTVLTLITDASALSLLQSAATKAGYTGAITKEMVADFKNKYNAEVKKQPDYTATSGTTKTELTADNLAVKSTSTNQTQVQKPSLFDGATYASDYIWSKVDFTKVSAGGKALDAITKVRQIVNDSGNLGVSLVEIQNYARQIGSGKLDENGLTAIMNKQAAQDYPLFADRLNDTPGATVKSLVDPYISSIAKVLEIPKDSIELNNPYLQKAIRPDGTVGKLPAMSIPDFERMLMDTPEWQKTKQANDKAYSAAMALSNALGVHA
jgi:hypothetical protein